MKFAHGKVCVEARSAKSVQLQRNGLAFLRSTHDSGTHGIRFAGVFSRSAHWRSEAFTSSMSRRWGLAEAELCQEIICSADMNTANRESRIATLFEQAKDLSKTEQRRFLRQACAQDPADIREAVQDLLDADIGVRDLMGHRNDDVAATSETVLAEFRSLPIDAIPGYRILKELSRGGQGVIYQAVQESTHRKVALKVMLEGPFAGSDSKRRFEREIALVGSLRHPGIVPVFESGVAQGRFLLRHGIYPWRAADGPRSARQVRR